MADLWVYEKFTSGSIAGKPEVTEIQNISVKKSYHRNHNLGYLSFIKFKYVHKYPTYIQLKIELGDKLSFTTFHCKVNNGMVHSENSMFKTLFMDKMCASDQLEI